MSSKKKASLLKNQIPSGHPSGFVTPLTPKTYPLPAKTDVPFFEILGFDCMYGTLNDKTAK